MFGKSTKQQITEINSVLHQDLDKACGELREKIKEGDSKLQERVGKIEDFIQTRFKAVEEKAEQAFDGRGYCDKAIADLLSTVGVDVERHNKEVATAQSDLSRALNNIEFLERDLKHRADELSLRLEELANRAEARDEATSGLEAAVSALKVRSSQLSTDTHALQEQVATLNAAAESSKQESGDRLTSVSDLLVTEVQRMEEAAAKQQADLRSDVSALEYAVTELGGRVKKEITQHGSKSADSMEDFKRQLDARFEAMEGDVDRAREAVSMVVNTFTKSVEWTIRGAKRKIKAPELEEGYKGSVAASKWLSPKFQAGGLRDLQLELQVFNPEAYADGHQDDMRDCALLLWANAGVTAVFRLWIGSHAQVVEKSFEGHEPHGAHRLCIVEKAINNRGELPMGVEILEVTYEEDIKAPISQGPDSPRLQRENTSALPADMAAGSQPAPLEGGLHIRRHVNNRIFGQVSKMAEQMQARLIRRVEWKFEQASQLQRNFGPGSPIYSKEFGAGGILGLQFIFYPSGYFGAEEGYCSLFLHAPPGTFIAGNLQLGTQRREISHSFDEKGNYGKTNFCRLDSCFDANSPTDSVLLAFEIDEASQEDRHSEEHRQGTPNTKMRATSGGNRSTLVSKKRAPPSTLIETKALPTLWATGRPVHTDGRSRAGLARSETGAYGPLGASGKLMSGATSDPNLATHGPRAKRAAAGRSGVSDELRW
mmetsp:Transcript_4048/g.8759  ORF Transcript_4048/g.8759 Transcript_4048/m.8759 type:complete len:712 (-) Transcript_4048:11-2146(-)